MQSEFRDYYPVDEAINDLIDFFTKKMTNKDELEKMIIFLKQCKEDQYLPMRNVSAKYSNYLEVHSQDQKPLTEDEKEMLGDLMHFWG